jgi:hypothetical protein
MKLVGKERDGAKVTKRYDVPQTPYQRVRATVELNKEARERLETEHAAIGPVALRRRLGEAIRKFWPLQVGSESREPGRTACG